MDENDYREGKDLLVQGLFGLLGSISFLVPWFLIRGIPTLDSKDVGFPITFVILVFMFGAVPFYKMAIYMLQRLGRCQSVSRVHLAWIGFMHGFFILPMVSITIVTTRYLLFFFPSGIQVLVNLIIIACISGVAADLVAALFLRVTTK